MVSGNRFAHDVWPGDLSCIFENPATGDDHFMVPIGALAPLNCFQS
jgi:hypothetical protein